jgi:hypothetical protein
MSLPLLGLTLPTALAWHTVDLLPAAVVAFVLVALAVALVVSSGGRRESDE